MTTLEQIGQRAKQAGRALALATSAQKNTALLALADALCDVATIGPLLEVNAGELAAGRDAGLSPALLDRMQLSAARLAAIAADVRTVAALPDPVGEEYDARTLPNALRVSRRRVPLGVVGVIYEARPNVTVDCAALCLKSGNAAILRAGKEITASSAALVALIQQALAGAGLPADAVQPITSPDRALVQQLLKLDRYVDVIIPRGGAALHAFCRENATMPVITGGIGVCHVYVDAAADAAKAVRIINNAKLRRPSVCNSLDTILVHASRAADLLPQIVRDLTQNRVELRLDEGALAAARVAGITNDPLVVAAQDSDFGTEFMGLVASVRVVADMDVALEHIARYGDHSDAIVTEDAAAAERFVASVDSAAVFVNASTGFNDGAQLGLGAEIAVSTQKLHVRGPMALQELTSYKWVVRGDGQIRS